MAGEVTQEIGRAYATILLCCLEACVPKFRPQFEVSKAPEKMSFRLPSGTEISFDATATCRVGPVNRGVLLEFKGYSSGDALLGLYRNFVVQSFVVSAKFSQHQNDLFMFVTNAPFGGTVGRDLTDVEWVLDVLRANAESAEIVAHPNAVLIVKEFCERLTVAIFTDSFIKRTGVRYTVESGESLWAITDRIHGGTIPYDMYEPYAASVGQANGIDDPNVLQPGQVINLPWQGIRTPSPSPE